MGLWKNSLSTGVDSFVDNRKGCRCMGTMMISNGELLTRLVLSCILGGIIGYERQSRRKSAGLRTNVLVCLGACLIMVMSEGIYQGVEGHTNADPARLAAQVVSGIGFLGAGAIMKEGLTVTGLTTAACLWVVAGVGLAVGGGFYSGALITTALVFVTLGTLFAVSGILLGATVVLTIASSTTMLLASNAQQREREAVEQRYRLDRATATGQPKRLRALGFPAPFDSDLEGVLRGVR